MATFEEFLLHCAGADLSCAKETPQNEIVKLTSIGKSILITTFFSTVSFFYAIYVISNQLLIPSILCVVWGAFIYNIDRYIVSSMMVAEHKFDEFKLFIPRLIIAILISFTIATPIELLIFEGEINEYLKQKELNEINNRIKAINEERDRVLLPLQKANMDWSKQLASLNSEIISCKDDESKLRESYICERDGTCGTGKIGLGPEALEKKINYLKVERKCNRTRGRNSRVIKTLRGETKANYKLIQKKEQYFKKLKEKVKPEVESTLSKSLLVRITTLSALVKNSVTVYFSVLLVTLLILAMELMPLFTKFLSSNGVYESCLRSLKDGKITSLREKRVETDEEISSIRKEIEKIKEDSVRIKEKFSNDITEQVNELKKQSYLSLFSENLDKILSEKQFSEELEVHIRNDISKHLLNGKYGSTESSTKFINISKKQGVLIFFLALVVVVSIFIYVATKNLASVKYFIVLVGILFNLYVFFKRLASNKLTHAPSTEGL